MLASGTSASTHTRDRSAIVSSVVDGSTDVPTVTPRFTTTPLLRRDHGHQALRFAGLLDRVDLRGVIPRTPSRVRPLATTTLVMPEADVCLPRGQVLGLRREQLLRKDAGERLAGPHHLARGVDVELFDPARHSRVHVRDARFVGHDGGDGPDRLRQRLAPDRFEADAELLNRRRGDVDRHAVVSGVRRLRSAAGRAMAIAARLPGARLERPRVARVLHPQAAGEQQRRSPRRPRWARRIGEVG